MKNHKQIVVKYNDEEIEIDELLAPLISILWKNNIDTVFSCQEDEVNLEELKYPVKMAYIQFDGEKNALKFLNLAVTKFAKYAKLIDEDYHDDWNPYPLRHWHYDYYPQWDYDHNRSFLMINIYFPTKDISIITKILNNEKISQEEIESLKCYYE